MAFVIFLSVDFLWSILVAQELGNEQSPPAEPHTGGKHIYDGVLPGAPTGSFAILLPLPHSERHAAFGNMPYTLPSVKHSLPRTQPPVRRGCLGLDSGGVAFSN
jgi:hypothetical protein